MRSKGCLSNKTALAMVFKLAQAAQNSWRRLDGHNQLPKLIVGVKFIDGIEAVRQQPQAAARPKPSPRFGYSSFRTRNCECWSPRQWIVGTSRAAALTYSLIETAKLNGADQQA